MPQEICIWYSDREIKSLKKRDRKEITQFFQHIRKENAMCGGVLSETRLTKCYKIYEIPLIPASFFQNHFFIQVRDRQTAKTDTKDGVLLFCNTNS